MRRCSTARGRRRSALELRRPAEAGEAAIGGGDDFAVQHQHPAFVRAAEGPLAGKVPACRERADQGHLTRVILFEAQSAGQWLARDFREVHAEMFGKLGRKRDYAKLFIRRPFAVRSRESPISWFRQA